MSHDFNPIATQLINFVFPRQHSVPPNRSQKSGRIKFQGNSRKPKLIFWYFQTNPFFWDGAFLKSFNFMFWIHFKVNSGIWASLKSPIKCEFLKSMVGYAPHFMATILLDSPLHALHDLHGEIPFSDRDFQPWRAWRSWRCLRIILTRA